MSGSALRATEPAYRTILVPLDGSHFAKGALPTARALAARFGATIHVVTVASSDFELDRRRVETTQAVGTDPDDPRIHVEVDTDVAAAVHRLASNLDACLICLSTHGRGRASGTLIGSTAREIIERCDKPVVVAGPVVVHADLDDETEIRPLGVDHIVACVDGTRESELGLEVVAAWGHALRMKLTVVTVAEPCPPPVRIGVPWRRHHGPNEDADEYVRRLGEQWALAAPGLDTAVVYDPIGPASGMKDYLAAHPTGLVAVTSHVRGPLAHLVFGSGAADIVHASTAPVLMIPVVAVKE
jgi:nucleotide-binding universal stress UspA family protein